MGYIKFDVVTTASNSTSSTTIAADVVAVYESNDKPNDGLLCCLLEKEAGQELVELLWQAARRRWTLLRLRQHYPSAL